MVAVRGPTFRSAPPFSFAVVQSPSPSVPCGMETYLMHRHRDAGQSGGLSRPAKDDYLLPELLLGDCSQSGTEEIDAEHFVTEGLGNIGEQLSRADHHAKVGRLVTDHVSQLCAGAESVAEVCQVPC